MSECVVPCNHFETGYNGKHTLIKVELHLYFMWTHTEVPNIVKLTMARVVSDEFT